MRLTSEHGMRITIKNLALCWNFVFWRRYRWKSMVLDGLESFLTKKNRWLICLAARIWKFWNFENLKIQILFFLSIHVALGTLDRIVCENCDFESEHFFTCMQIWQVYCDLQVNINLKNLLVGYFVNCWKRYTFCFHFFNFDF